MQKNVAYTTKQGSLGIWLAQTDFAAFGEGVLLISGSPYTEKRITFPTNLSKWYIRHLMMISNQSWT